MRRCLCFFVMFCFDFPKYLEILGLKRWSFSGFFLYLDWLYSFYFSGDFSSTASTTGCNTIWDERPYDGGVCSRGLMQYLYHQRQRPADNSIAYWRKFVSEYYSPRAKKRWCLSLYDNVGHHTLWVFPQDAWQCDICGSKSGRGFVILGNAFHEKESPRFRYEAIVQFCGWFVEGKLRIPKGEGNTIVGFEQVLMEIAHIHEKINRFT
ncbi:probable transcriptional regulator SLK2 isoform X5 [Coffea arabica]|uniref:Probable transcriptional regulator SLK2 isoform X5 n=1 Tax=Coffea arabica TaxID=13443 RepID=A0ABM4UXA2_COFAR